MTRDRLLSAVGKQVTISCTDVGYRDVKLIDVGESYVFIHNGASIQMMLINSIRTVKWQECIEHEVTG